jgi:hypothetical protein
MAGSSVDVPLVHVRSVEATDLQDVKRWSKASAWLGSRSLA